MDQLRIRLFGDLRIRYGGELLPAFPTLKAKSLFAFLVLHRGRPVPRDILCGHFWGERSDAEARKTLRTTLWRVRQVLRPVEAEGIECLRVESGQVCFHGPAWVDVDEFESCLAGSGASSTLPEPERLARAADLYRADLLEGSYDRWCQPERDRLRLAFLTALERLLDHHHEGGEWREAIRWGAQLLRWDPLREHVHRRLMLCHLANGDRPSALRQFRTCAHVLAEELGIEPMEETERLHRTIRAGVPFGVISGTPASSRAGSQEPVELLDLAHSVEDALIELRGLLGRLEQAAVVRETRPPLRELRRAPVAGGELGR